MNIFPMSAATVEAIAGDPQFKNLLHTERKLCHDFFYLGITTILYVIE